MKSETKRNPTPAERSKAVREAFEAKVAVLEQWARAGIPEGVEVPKNKTQLPKWTGPGGDLRQWSDRSIFNKHPVLAQRFTEALANIEKRRAAKGKPLKELEAEIAALRSERKNLELQNAKLIADIDRLQRRIQVLADLLTANGLLVPP